MLVSPSLCLVSLFALDADDPLEDEAAALLVWQLPRLEFYFLQCFSHVVKTIKKFGTLLSDVRSCSYSSDEM